MDEERAWGQVQSLRVRREKALAYAQEMLPLLKRARAEGASTYRELADWLNAREYKTVRDKGWRHQTVWQLLHIDYAQIEQAEDDRKIEMARLARETRRLSPDDRERAKESTSERRREIERQFRDAVKNANRIGAALRGEERHVEPAEVTFEALGMVNFATARPRLQQPSGDEQGSLPLD